MAGTRSVDRGANALLARAKRLSQGVEVRIGMLDKAQAEHKGTPGLTVAEVGTFHEFGLGVPQRSFIRGWYDESVEENKRTMAVLQKQVLRGQVSEEQALARFGAKCVGDIQKRIVDGIEPPLAESTVKRKGSSTPLVDTGQLKASITFEVGAPK